MAGLRINPKLLYFKLHYLVMCGGYGGAKPFLGIFAKHIGITATATSLAFAAVTGLDMVFLPLIGSIVDHFRNIKTVIICLILMTAAAAFGMLFIPTIPVLPALRTELTNGSNWGIWTNSEVLGNLSELCDMPCLEETAKLSNCRCSVFTSNMSGVIRIPLCSKSDDCIVLNSTHGEMPCSSSMLTVLASRNLTLTIHRVNMTLFLCCIDDFQSCLEGSRQQQSDTSQNSTIVEQSSCNSTLFLCCADDPQSCLRHHQQRQSICEAFQFFVFADTSNIKQACNNSTLDSYLSFELPMTLVNENMPSYLICILNASSCLRSHQQTQSIYEAFQLCASADTSRNTTVVEQYGDNSTLGVKSSWIVAGNQSLAFLRIRLSDIHPRLEKTQEPRSIYQQFQFWIFAILLIIGGVTSGSAMNLSDVACYTALGQKPQLYGRQRLYGTIGWALVCFLGGYLNDLFTGDNEKNFSPSFCLGVGLLLVDSLILWQAPVENRKVSRSSIKDIRIVFTSFDVLLFGISAVFSGILNFSIAAFEFWHLQELGASQALLGGAIVMQCLVGEVPFFIVSGWFVKNFGCFFCLVGSFLAYSMRLGMYAIITNPAWALLIDVSHGLTFAMFYAALTSFSSARAPDGLEATMFGILNGLYSGLGICIGGLLIGNSIDSLGKRATFTIASLTSLTIAILIALLRIMCRVKGRKTKNIEFNDETIS